MINRYKYYKNIKNFIDKPQIIKVITGMRRSGKSYFLKQIIRDLNFKDSKQAKNIIFIDKESLDFEEIDNYKALNNYVKDHIDSEMNNYLLIDEVQEIEYWEKAIRSFYNQGSIDIYISGSNSNLLSSELSTFLNGRYVEFQIYPLAFSEFLDFRKYTQQNQTEKNIESKHINSSNINLKDEFNLFLKYGGMPGIHQLTLNSETSYKYLQAIINTIIFKDVVKRFEIRNISLLENIINYAFKNIGSNLSAKNVNNYLKTHKLSSGYDTIQNYLKFLNDAYILSKCSIYNLAGKKLLVTNDKFFVSDHGLKHSQVGYREEDIAGLLENIVYLELLRRGYKVNVGKLNELEIDFIASKAEQKIYIQVCYLLASAETREREFRSLLKIADNHPKYVLSMDETPKSNYEGVIRQHIMDFLLEEF
jgi:predicted AAA+ superfamily ATPase